MIFRLDLCVAGTSSGSGNIRVSAGNYASCSKFRDGYSLISSCDKKAFNKNDKFDR